MSSISTIGGAIQALRNGQELLDGFRDSSKAFKKMESAESDFIETASALKTLLVDAGYNIELVTHIQPKEGATDVEQSFYAFVTDAAVKTMPAKSQRLLEKDVDECKGVWYVEVNKVVDGVTKKVKQPNPKSEKGQRKLAQQNVGQYRKRFVQALQRAWAPKTDRSPNRSGQWVVVRQERLEAEIQQLKKATPEQLNGTDAIACQMFLERALDCLKGAMPKSVIAKYRAVK